MEPNNGVQYYYHRQIFPSTTADKEDFEANREVSWRFSASGQHAFVPQESNLVLKVKIQKSNDNFVANFQEAEKSIHYDSNTAAVLTVVCLSCVTDVSNCLLGVCFFQMNTIQQLMTLIARKTDLV